RRRDRRVRSAGDAPRPAPRRSRDGSGVHLPDGGALPVRGREDRLRARLLRLGDDSPPARPRVTGTSLTRRPACAKAPPMTRARILAVLQTQGYDCAITDAGSQDCDSDVAAAQCMELANQLSQNIDAALGLADESDRTAFQAGTQAIGFTPCQTTTTSTTTATVSTT